MATKQQPRQRSTSSRSGSSRGASSGSSASRRRPAAPPEPEAGALSRAVAALLDGHGHDLAGVVLVVVALVAGFGVWGGSDIAVPRLLTTAIAATVGLLRYVAPLAMLGAAVALIRGPQHPHDAETGEVLVIDDGQGARRFLGSVSTALGAAGLLHLVTRPGTIEQDGLDAFRDAGGFLGALVGVPLRALIGGWGAAAVLVVLLLLAVSLLTGRSLRELASAAAAAMAPAGAVLSEAVRGLFRVGADDDDDGDVDDGPVIQLYDQDADAPARKPRAPRKKPTPAEPTITVPGADAVAEQLEIQLEPRNPNSPWTLPPLTLLSRSKNQEVDTEAIAARGRELEAALAEHGVTTRLVGMVVGPTVTRYELELGVGVKVNQVVNLHKDIAYAMASPDVRILAPIPGKQAIGVEIPNRKRQIIALGDILASPEALKARSPLSVAVGRDIEGHSLMVDLAKMPHILIAGQTGAGKSSCINSIMTSILMRATPDDVRLILVDPKRVELTQYNRVPHLLTQVVTNPKKAANALAWAVAEMERRYELLEEVGVRDIGGYNAAFDRGELAARLGEERELQRMPLILIVVDELADLMMVAARDVEESINRIAAKARAVGLHLVIATQRPSVNVITGVIKANIPARFAFSVASATDSKVIMNTGGAERLVGQGDMLFLGPTSSSAERVQGCWVEEKEVAAVVALWRKQAPEVSYVEEVQGDANLAVVAQPGSGGGVGGGDEDDDDLMWQAMELVVRSQLGSTSMLQRKLKVGFARAGRLMDLLEEKGVVGPSGGSKAREVLMTVEELEELLTQR